MSTRLANGGNLVDRTRSLDFTFNGKRMKGFVGDTLASALLANDQVLVGRSFKYHRPRGIVASGPEEPNALMCIGSGPRLEPNQRATVTELHDGLVATSQNHWPTLERDVGAVADLASRMLPAGFYYKTFIQPRAAWKHLFEPVIRQAAGLGRAPTERDIDAYEHFHAHVDILVVGGGIAGLLAAATAARSGASVLLAEQSSCWGGRSRVDVEQVDGRPTSDWVQAMVEGFAEMPNIHARRRMTVAGLYDHGYVLALERASDHDPAAGGIRHRLWRIRADRIILATGAIERPICFAGNDVPGVMLASAVRDYVADFAVSPGDRTVVVTNHDDAYRTALTLAQNGLNVPAVLDTRPVSDGQLVGRVRELGIRVLCGQAIASVAGRQRVRAVTTCSQAGEGSGLETIECEAVAMSGGWSPAVHLWSHCGGKLAWNEESLQFVPLADRSPVRADGQPQIFAAGAAAGILQADGIAASVEEAIGQALDGLGRKAEPAKVGISVPEEQAIAAVWLAPQGMNMARRSKAFVDFQNDVKASDIELAAREGYRSVEHAKRYTTLGMATDQGKLSNINGLAILSAALNASIPDVGTTTFRPPYTPVALGAIAGESRRSLFKPERKTPIDSWHAENGAHWEPVADWRRPYCYRRGPEGISDAVNRESLRVRRSIGILDASTLGKILVAGEDAGKFLDMIYTNIISNLPVGRCRYGLMCNDNGFLMDDGVVARLSENEFLCHTTTGGADHVHAWMERWLQTEWWNWKVFTANLTDQFAQINIAGPSAGRLISKIGGSDLVPDALPFMHWKESELAGCRVRVFRISFSGELSYEIAVEASRGLDLWKALMEAGAEFEIEPYGTEALHVLRAEKGYIMIGEESDGTVTPQDLNLHWAISKKKTDFLGKRAQQRSFLQDPLRWRLVGLETIDAKTPLPIGIHAVDDGHNRHGHRRMFGRVTSSYFSPILDRAIALGLIECGPDRMGEIIEFAGVGDRMSARIVDPVFYDREGAKRDG